MKICTYICFINGKSTIFKKVMNKLSLHIHPAQIIDARDLQQDQRRAPIYAFGEYDTDIG